MLEKLCFERRDFVRSPLAAVEILLQNMKLYPIMSIFISPLETFIRIKNGIPDSYKGASNHGTKSDMG